MKKFMCFLFAAVLLFGIVGSADASFSYTLSDVFSTDQGSDTGDVTIAGSSGTAITVTGASTATAASVFQSAKLIIIVDSFSAPTASNFAAWFDSARGLYGLTATGTNATAVSYGNLGTPPGSGHYSIEFDWTAANFPNEFGTDTWYASSLVMGIGDSSIFSHSMERADLTITYNSVPIPGAVWLLSSGLIGLVGLRRKFRK